MKTVECEKKERINKPKITKPKKSVETEKKPNLQKQKKPKPKKEKKEQKKMDIPHSVNRFKGKYKEIPIELKNSKFTDSELIKKEEELENYKKRVISSKLISLKIRRENYYLMTSGEKQVDNYVDPDEIRKKKEREREKKEKEENRKKWRAKLDNRRTEMGLDFIKEEPSRPKTTEQVVKNQEKPLKKGQVNKFKESET